MIGIDAGLIPAHLQVQSSLRRVNRRALLLDLLRKDPGLRQIVFYLLEGSEDRLAIAGYIGVVNGNVLMELRAERGVENGLREARTHRPEAAGPVEDMLEQRALISAGRGEREGREESRIGYAEFRIGCSHGSFGGSNIGPALQQQRRHADGNRRRRGRDRARGKGETGSRFTNQDSNRVLILRPQNTQIGQRSLG